MANSDSRWIFAPEQIDNSPSRRDGMSAESELSMRQTAAIFIHEIGCKLKVSQICINTAIIYMHRFYMIHSFTKFHHNVVCDMCIVSSIH